MRHFKFSAILFRCSRSICTTIQLSQKVPRKILENLKSTPREYHRDDEEFSDKPIKFTESRATGSASDSLGLAFQKVGTGPPKIHTPLQLISLACFMIYFMVLREENDVDEMMNTSPQNLYEKMPGLEKIHVEAAIKNYKLEGRDTTDLEDRLADLLSTEENAKQ